MKNIMILSFLCLGFLFSCGNKHSQESFSNPTTEQDDSKKYTLTKKTSPAKKTVSTVPPEQLAKAKEIIAALSKNDIAAVDAKQLFKLSCASCHGTTGNLKANGATDLTKSTSSIEDNVAQIYFGKGVMLPYKRILSEAEIVALAGFVESFRK
jgi:mono/diheme cytochrome c family protein